MSARYNPTSGGDPRFARHRSPLRGSERRTPPPFNDTSLGPRGNDSISRAGDAYNMRRDIPREPPRGPKALVDGSRGGFAPRGRGFRGRGDSHDRDFRDSRDDMTYNRRGRGQDWGPRDRFDARDRRLSPTGRDRSRSPSSRDFRDYRDAPSHSSSSAVDYPVRGRGGYRGRGRGSDWDHGPKRTAVDVDEREAYRVRSDSRERVRTGRDERLVDGAKRDDFIRQERDDRDDRPRNQPLHRPDSRNSAGALTSRSTSAASVQPNSSERNPKHVRESRERAFEYDRRLTGPDITSTQAESHRSDGISYRRIDSDLYGSRNNSPPPQAPPVPAFGSVPPNIVTADRPTVPKEDANSIHPSRVSMMEHTKEIPSAPRAHTVSGPPTGPKAQQQDRELGVTGREPPRGPTDSEILRAQEVDAGNARVKQRGNAYPERGRSRMDEENQEYLPPAGSVLPPSVKKAVEEQGRNGISSSSGEDLNPLAAMKGIPTGPKADRGTPSARPAPVSIRAPQSRPPPIMARGGISGRGQAHATWINPALKASRGPGPSIMNSLPSKRDSNGLEQTRRVPSITESSIDRRRSYAGPNDKQADTTSNEALEDKKFVEASTASDLIDREIKADLYTSNVNKDEDSDEGVDNAEMDENDYAEDERKFELKMLALEAKRPPSPRSNTILLDMLEELDALASALEEKIQDGSADETIKVESAALGLPSPKTEEEDALDGVHDESRSNLPLRMRMQTPPIESLPFLATGPPTPFSDIHDMQDDSGISEQVKVALAEQISNQQLALDTKYSSIRADFKTQYKAWRSQVEDEEEEKRAKDEVSASSPPPELADQTAQSTPSLGRRGRAIVSEYDYQRLLKASEESAAREERQRREREERVYIPPDTFNDQREAVVPVMLDPYKAEDRIYAERGLFIPTNQVLDALAFIPPKDAFTPDEHEAFLYHYVQFPKKFGIISKQIPGRTYQDCVQHYYATKSRVPYKNHEINFWKTKRGKQVARKRAPGGLLIRSGYDGQMESEAQAIALTEKGRPRRAAAPTFGDAGDAEQPSTAVTPGRRSTVGKESMPVSAEKPKRSRIVPAVKQKPGRKPNTAPLLAAAPGPSTVPSPPRLEPSIVKAVDGAVATMPSERVEENEVANEAAQVLASINKHTITQHYTVPTVQTMTHSFLQPDIARAPQQRATSESLRQEQGQSVMQHQLGDSAAPINSYWNVSETQDLKNYLAFFGQEWNKIAERIPAKTTTMVKNRYNKLVKEGDKALEQACENAMARRDRGEDMGPEPAPTPVSTKRRYDSSQRSTDTQRALAPLVENTEMDRDVPVIRPKSSQMAMPAFPQAQPKFSASAHAEQGAAALSSQMLSQGPGSPASRIDLLMHQQRPQPILQGPRLGQFSETRRPSHPHSDTAFEPVETSTSQVARGTNEHNQHKQQRRRQDDQELQMSHQQYALSEHTKSQHSKSKQQPKQERMLSDQPQEASLSRDRPIGQFESPAFDPSGRAAIQVDENSRGIIEKRQQEQQKKQIERQQEIELHRQRQQLQQQNQHQQALRQQHQQQQQIIADNHAPARRFGSNAYVETRFQQHTPSHSTASSAFPTPTSPSGQRLLRPSSVPAIAASQQPPAPVQPKKSSIMSLLNDEPSESKPIRNVAEPRRIPTPPRQIQAPRYDPPPKSQSIDQMLHRREPPMEQVHYSQGHVRANADQPSVTTHKVTTAREPSRDWQSELRRPNLYEHKPPNYQSAVSHTQPQPSPQFVNPSTRYQTLQQREHAPSPPPSHSRTSSLTSLPPQMKHRSSASNASVEHSLRPSPYTTLNPHQPTHQHHNAPHHQHHSPQEQARVPQSTQVHHPFHSQTQQEAALMQRARQEGNEMDARDRENLVRLHQQAAQQPPSQQHRERTDRFDIRHHRSSEDIHARIPDLQRQQAEALRVQMSHGRVVEDQQRRDQEAQMRRHQEREALRPGGRFTPFYNESGGYAPPAPLRDPRDGDGRGSLSGNGGVQGRGLGGSYEERR